MLDVIGICFGMVTLVPLKGLMWLTFRVLYAVEYVLFEMKAGLKRHVEGCCAPVEAAATVESSSTAMTAAPRLAAVSKKELAEKDKEFARSTTCQTTSTRASSTDSVTDSQKSSSSPNFLMSQRRRVVSDDSCSTSGPASDASQTEDSVSTASQTESAANLSSLQQVESTASSSTSQLLASSRKVNWQGPLGTLWGSTGLGGLVLGFDLEKPVLYDRRILMVDYQSDF